MEEGVADDANTNVDILDVVLDGGDRFFDVLKGRVVAELLARVVNLLVDIVQSVVNFLQFTFQVLHVLRNRVEIRLNVAQLFRVRTIVTRHSLEVTRQNLLFA